MIALVLKINLVQPGDLTSRLGMNTDASREKLLCDSIASCRRKSRNNEFLSITSELSSSSSKRSRGVSSIER